MTTDTFQDKKELLFVVLHLYIIHNLCKVSIRDVGLQGPEENANPRLQVHVISLTSHISSVADLFQECKTRMYT